MIYYVGPLDAVEEITETPWVRLSFEGGLGITKRVVALDPVPTGCTQLTYAQALEEVAKPEWNKDMPNE